MKASMPFEVGLVYSACGTVTCAGTAGVSTGAGAGEAAAGAAPPPPAAAGALLTFPPLVQVPPVAVADCPRAAVAPPRRPRVMISAATVAAARWRFITGGTPAASLPARASNGVRRGRMSFPTFPRGRSLSARQARQDRFQLMVHNRLAIERRTV